MDTLYTAAISMLVGLIASAIYAGGYFAGRNDVLADIDEVAVRLQKAKERNNA